VRGQKGSGSTQAVSHHGARSEASVLHEARGSDQVINVRGYIRVCEIAFTLTKSGEIKSQNRVPALCDAISKAPDDFV